MNPYSPVVMASAKRGCKPILAGDSIQSPSPIRLTGSEKKADAFAYKARHLLSKDFRLMSHQGAHQHGKKNEIHENLCRSDTSFRAERSLRRSRKRVGDVVQLVGYSF